MRKLLEELKWNDPEFEWQQRAACKAYEPSIWFPAPEETRKLAQARRICSRCPVQDECLKEAINLGTTKAQGIWGGKSERERWEIIHGRPRGKKSKMV